MSKRLFDLLVAAIGLVLTAPVTVLCAGAIKLGSRGPILYRATRVGKDGDAFTMHKFRTMTNVPEGGGSRITARGDARVTRMGRVLRASKLDELPQLWDVLRGDMSLVGPRPEDPHYVALYDEEQRRVLSVRPGVTGPTAIAFRHEEQLLAAADDPEHVYIHQVLPAKLAIDLDYVDHRSFLGDVAILLRTLTAVFRSPDPKPLSLEE
jgi:lipopolysaccharide/colanic/teichoic acid biosynthesis glycosyltransferase